MPLPLIPLPTTTIDVGGQKVTIRSLSRGERLAIAGLEDDARVLEAYVVGLSVGVDPAEAREWLAGVLPDIADKLVLDVMEWSGLITPRPADAQEDANEPEDPSQGSTEEQGSGEPSSEP